MKNCIFFLFFVLVSTNLFAQKYGFIDSEKILSTMAEYKDAQAEIEKATVAWQNEVDVMQKNVIAKRLALEAEKVLFTEEMQKQKNAEIEAEENKVRAFQNKIFGYNGLLYQKREDLFRSVQDKIYAATQMVARKKKLAFVFDKSNDFTMIYADPTHDYTEYVLEELGLGAKMDK
ncbi:MAG: OmpH family outer membrane protein [Bacteroidetes bacterium]|nr:MAG: OmpH family outer membrane protein [Bacteroidota bacterium]